MHEKSIAHTTPDVRGPPSKATHHGACVAVVKKPVREKASEVTTQRRLTTPEIHGAALGEENLADT